VSAHNQVFKFHFAVRKRRFGQTRNCQPQRVLNHDKRLVGIVSLRDIVVSDGGRNAGDALHGISGTGGQHSQAAPGAQAM
jgi:hypothetical protein